MDGSRKGLCLTVLSFSNKVFGRVWDLKAFLSPRRIESRLLYARKRQEISRIRGELRATKEQAEIIKLKKRLRSKRQEIFQLQREIRSEKERAQGALDGRPALQGVGRSETGALPNFVIIGARKCGTTFLYSLLTQHPNVEPAAKKELHYFDSHSDDGIEWYRRCFPSPRWKNGRRTITGEATPYLSCGTAPERMAKVAPQARLIALLRNPVDRAYSDYQQVARKGREPLTFEEAIVAEKTRLLGKRDDTSEHEETVSLDEARSGYLTRSIYVDQLLRWSEFFGDEQLLVLNSQDLFERTSDTLELVRNFLDLPNWELEASEISKAWENSKKGNYKQRMDPATRQRLEEYFEPHNRRLYEYLGVDFGW